MEFAKKINGAVLYVDILGFGALTQKQIKPEKSDFIPWLESHKHNDPSVEYTNQFLAASLLATFRTILLDMGGKFEAVNVAQLSDCAFIWSEKIADVVIFANNFMTRAIEDGLLCRGGLSYGEIIETDKNDYHKLGKFIVGEAITKAVTLERILKGCRICIDKDLPDNLSEYDRNLLSKVVQRLTNPLNNSVHNEFKWYSELKMDSYGNSSVSDKKATIEKYIEDLESGKKFSWNRLNKEGQEHIDVSIAVLRDTI